MTKAFLETMVLKPENEKLVTKAFSKKSIAKVREFDSKKRLALKRTADRRLSVKDLLALS